MNISFLDVFYYMKKYIRKKKGGVWELWWVDHPVCSEVWYKVDKSDNLGRPNNLCRGNFIKREDYT